MTIRAEVSAFSSSTGFEHLRASTSFCFKDGTRTVRRMGMQKNSALEET